MSDDFPSLPARLYLLCCDPGRAGSGHDPALARLVRSGALAELAGRGLLTGTDGADGVVEPRDLDAHSGDPALDGLLELVMESRPRPWASWVTCYAGVTLDAVRAQLTAAGLLRADRGKGFGLLRPVRYEPVRAQPVRELQRRARHTLTGPGPVTAVSGDDAVLAVLAVAGGVCTVTGPADRVCPGDCACHGDRVEALTEHAARAVPPLKEIVRGLWSAVSGPGAAARPGG
ncbi:GPP34 family phosphoprotein [Streptomyces sp. NPDC052040]|uniref:GOLPH3/VPS74 family protein n=1 Tax=unclassified Streptomyces TaxID=2593676 RepID=UPI0037CFD9E0